MFRTGVRAALRSHKASSLAPARTAGRRYLSTEPPHLKSRSWKNSAFRWGLAIAGIYYYNTSPVFAEYPQSNLLNPNVDAIDEERGDHPTIDRLLESSRNKSQKDASKLQTAIETNSERAVDETQQNAQTVAGSPQADSEAASATSAAADLEAEAEGEGAFNPVTGEINWDCPCLGGMAYGPCGEEFRSAFSCFVYSTEEPKGMDCIEKFGAMQDCFRAHPEVYKGELEDDETLDGELAAEKEELRKEIEERREQVQMSQSQRRHLSDEPAAPTAQTPESSSESQKSAKPTQLPSNSLDTPQPETQTTGHSPSEYSSQRETEHGAASQTVRQPKTKVADANAIPESDQLVPKSAHDATDTTSGQSTVSVK